MDGEKMVGGISAVSNAYSPYAASSARRAAETEQPFAIPSSALRIEKSGSAARPAETDSVTLSRDFPQLFASATYAPPPVQRAAAPAQPMQCADAAGSAAPAADATPVREPSAAARTASNGSSAVPGLGAEMDARANGVAADSLPAEDAEPGAAENPAENSEETALPGENAAGESENADAAGEAEEGDDPATENGADGQDLSEGEQEQLTELKNRDREVRAHEAAHQAVGGAFAGAASFSFQQGPDGQRYAIGGEVSIDMSPERDPQATIAKMQQVKAAAMAPASPSGQDRAVAASATATEMQARSEMASSGAEGEEGTEGAGEASDAAAGSAEAPAEGSENAAGESADAGESEDADEVGAAAADAQSANAATEPGASESAPGVTGSMNESGRTAEPFNRRAAVGESSADNGMTPLRAHFSRTNPYQRASDSGAANSINLPEAYRAINIVA